MMNQRQILTATLIAIAVNTVMISIILLDAFTLFLMPRVDTAVQQVIVQRIAVLFAYCVITTSSVLWMFLKWREETGQHLQEEPLKIPKYVTWKERYFKEGT